MLWGCQDDVVIVDEEHVEARVDESYDVKPFEDLPVSGQLQGEWQRRLEANSTLFDASKFRLAKVKECDGKVVLQIGICGYRSFIVTNCHPSGELFKRLETFGNEKFDDPRAYIADPLGVGAMVISEDNKLVMIRRSNSTGEYQGYLDLPGGHPEPLRASKLKLDPEKAFVKELFWSISDEVIGEVNIPAGKLEHPRLTGIMRQAGQSRGRPSCLFLISCHLSSLDILSLYKQGGSEKDESTELVFADRIVAGDLLADPSGLLTPQCRVGLSQFQCYIDQLATK
uniref:Nudix hydrolase domain-containing protein n=1 Tax=Mucochytrium quahogii TaxID=96639 RepID=A0A7S2R9A6_9STRA|mmetsp:Transcript_484/g.848  ORF Transcript_484/g.848 Transcript_484/m.848 type:complete len:284 (-) Transcript_484:196-1047(-)|eukprot:CAMPEP_0203760618 /NCGR_PEP_ID=MMETSP0098-20131031/13877_1 /ASSEMBLY_ACC=CAM_ASM_000208 /TAXON_ID=96639 /ORGANISM=" , Strain NY0313808BC1" /LENGTH=283 /DNA_ID=CAMNT_0050654265 /DNA_START=499 /DNA_END=1350 /DNA_ORIENTATION=+